MATIKYINRFCSIRRVGARTTQHPSFLSNITNTFVYGQLNFREVKKIVFTDINKFGFPVDYRPNLKAYSKEAACLIW